MSVYEENEVVNEENKENIPPDIQGSAAKRQRLIDEQSQYLSKFIKTNL